MRGSLLWPMLAGLVAAMRGCWRCASVLAVRQRGRDCSACRVLGMALAAVLLLPPSLLAQAADVGALRQAATGARFSYGHSTYRLIPGAVVRLHAEQRLRGPHPADAGDHVAARVGPYAILLGREARDAAHAPPDPSTPDECLVAAINELTAQTVLVAPKLKLFGTTPAVADALARRTGGTTVYASAMDGSAAIRYGSVEAAHAALVQLQNASGVTEVALQVIQSVDERN
ncbi:hypothetical protein A6R73_00055 [Xanthomonas translucens pv. poae]|uniref:Uncharacterized protein n=2 Tax=Xanthomonas translucens group TaxID=3390202 RepID=A0A199PAI9_9XANT|nr:hypothetical protein A6R73_00055 [Xanthomonas translucens pv. poae]